MEDYCMNCDCGNDFEIATVGREAPEFEAKAFHNAEVKTVKLADYKGKWVVLFFYPADFTFVCPTELGDLADMYDELQKLNVEVLSVSTDTHWVHKAWHEDSETIKKIKFAMVADPTHEICDKYGVLIPEEGIALRGTFVINPEGIIKTMEVHEDGIGRSAEELLRKIQAAQFIASNKGMVCPGNWKPGSKTLKPGLDLVGKI